MNTTDRSKLGLACAIALHLATTGCLKDRSGDIALLEATMRTDPETSAGSGGSSVDGPERPMPEVGGSDALDESPTMTTGVPPEDDAPLGSEELALGLGQSCNAPDECESAFCVDSVCCESACSGVCSSCATPGSEGACEVPSSDTECAPLSCPEESACLKYDQSEAAVNCEALGACRNRVDCTPLAEPEGTPCGDGGACDAEGRCVVEGKALLGEACEQTDDCSEGECVVGPNGSLLCCDSACNGVCEACSADGRCNAAAVEDARCEAVACPTDNICRDYQGDIASGACVARGQCATVRDCDFNELQPSAVCQCEGDGTCTLNIGEVCSEGVECSGVGACEARLDGTQVCCSNQCEPDEFCANNGQGCVECEENTVRCEGPTAISCRQGRLVQEVCQNGCEPGSGCNAQAPVGFLCESAQCQPGAVCQTDRDGARRCCSRDCAAEGRECTASGSCECPEGQVEAGSGCELALGDPCGAGGAPCGAGLQCVDGVCCAEACSGPCERCNASGTQGQCVLDANDGQSCGGNQQCVARGECRGRNQSTCNVNADCVSNNCENRIGGNGLQICCAEACTGNRPFCSSDGSRCVECQGAADCPNGCNQQQGLCNPLRSEGAICTQPTQCEGGSCITSADNAQQRRCCADCAPGQLCASNGQCENPPADAGGACGTVADCGAGLFCVDGTCCTSACNGPCQNCRAGAVGGGACNEIPATDPASCPPVACALTSNACRTVTPPAPGQCQGLGQCAGAAQCSVVNAPPQTPCGANAECDGQGNCIDVGPVCGDGNTDFGQEICDDGNNVSGDGCSADCTVAGLAAVGSSAFTSSHMCAVLGSGLATCWGLNSQGQLGIGSSSNNFLGPRLVSGLSGVEQVSLRANEGCARTQTGSVSCWGGGFGLAPSSVSVNDAAFIAAGGGALGTSPRLPHCAATASGEVVCWDDETAPTAVPGLTNVVQLAMGNNHMCALRSNGEVLCWGSNTQGELGLGIASGTPVATPTTSALLSGATQVATGDRTTCVLRSSGLVNCVGNAFVGGAEVVSNVNPVAIDGVTNAVKVVAGEQHACALLVDGQVRCWGGGSGSADSGSGVATIALPSPAVELGAGSLASCALLSDGSQHCWGSLHHLGAGQSSITPVEVDGFDLL